jgi:hypothetical protein
MKGLMVFAEVSFSQLAVAVVAWVAPFDVEVEQVTSPLLDAVCGCWK